MIHKKVIICIIIILLVTVGIIVLLQKKNNISDKLVGEWAVNSIQDETGKDYEPESDITKELSYSNLIILKEDNTFIEKNTSDIAQKLEYAKKELNGKWVYNVLENTITLNYENGNKLIMHIDNDSNNVLHLKTKIGNYFDYCKK